MATDTFTDSTPICPECQIPVVWDNYEEVCPNCGLIITQDNLVDSSFLLNMTQRSSESFHEQFVALGKQVNRPICLGTQIQSFTDYKGLFMTASNIKKFDQLRHLQKITAMAGHEDEYRIITMITKICRKLELPQYVEQNACYRWRKIATEAIVNHVSMAATCIYIAAKGFRVPCPLKVLLQACRDEGHRVSARLILRDSMNKTMKGKAATPREYLDTVLGQLRSFFEERVRTKGLNPNEWLSELDRQAKRITDYYAKHQHAKTNPYITAVALVYAAEYKIQKEQGWGRVFTQATLAECIGVDDYSIRDIFVMRLKPIFGHHH
jgi:transcription initiation factor TFIIIB Brf1 subunit/transcription initiation factor TFIIB